MAKTPVKKPAAKRTAAPVANESNNSLAIVSMVLGVTSLTGPGLLFGVPAIILATIALKKNQGERGLSITGLVTGIISTVLSVLFIIGFVLLIVLGIGLPAPTPEEAPAPAAHAHFEHRI